MATTEPTDVQSGQDAVLRELRELSGRVASLHTEVRRLAGVALPQASASGWDDEGGAPTSAPSYAWLTRLEPPVRRRPAVPRLLLEATFLIAVAALVAVADLQPLVIAAVMAGAWLLVALSEWAATSAERRNRELAAHVPPPAPAGPTPADPAWFSPPVEQTLLESGDSADSDTSITRLPPAERSEVTVERRPETSRSPAAGE